MYRVVHCCVSPLRRADRRGGQLRVHHKLILRSLLKLQHFSNPGLRECLVRLAGMPTILVVPSMHGAKSQRA